MQAIIDRNEKLKAEKEKSKIATERKKKYLQHVQSGSDIYKIPLPEIVKNSVDIKLKSELESKLYVCTLI